MDESKRAQAEKAELVKCLYLSSRHEGLRTMKGDKLIKGKNTVF